MKFLTLLLAIYFFSLNFYPCSDTHGDEEDSTAEISLDNDNHSDHDHCDSELCSPFCYCHCCQIHTSPVVLQNYALVKISYSKSIFRHFEKIHEGASFKPLQPPEFISQN
ncbi:DUF6660 family protein [Aquimarina gracilis]|uniref:DUF6660 family protein n=1 Tax=Aquimarina gracilis TaxID=874422 RepID=UPI0038993A9B